MLGSRHVRRFKYGIVILCEVGFPGTVVNASYFILYRCVLHGLRGVLLLLHGCVLNSRYRSQVHMHACGRYGLGGVLLLLHGCVLNSRYRSQVHMHACGRYGLGGVLLLLHGCVLNSRNGSRCHQVNSPHGSPTERALSCFSEIRKKT